MTKSTRKFSKLVLGATIRILTIALVLVGFGVSSTFAQPRAYVANRNDNTVSVIDSTTNTVVATVQVEGIGSIAVTPDGAFAYVTNGFSDTISVIETATNTVTATIPVGDGPVAIAFPTRGQMDPIGSLTAQVQTLIAGGTLTADQGAGLIDKLQQVQSKIDNGQTAAACNQLRFFINQVNAFLNSGSLTTSQGQALINAAIAIKTSLGC